MSVRVIVQRPGHPELQKAFSTSPVRLGRNAMNDLPLPETYVSEWHGAIRFDADTIEYTDLGSTNGTMLEGVKLTPGTPARVEGPTVFQIGPLTMLIEPVFGAELSGPVGTADAFPETPPPARGGGQAPVAGEMALGVTEAPPTRFNPPTLFGDRPQPPLPASAAAPPAARQPPPAAGDLRERRDTREPPAAALNPPTLFGMSAGVFRSPSPAPPAPSPSPAPPAAAPAPAPVVAPPPPGPSGAPSFNPPTLFGLSPAEIAGMRVPSPKPAASDPAPAAELGAVKRTNPPSLFGTEPATVAPPGPAAAPPGPSPLLRSGALKGQSPPTLFGVASGAIAKPVQPAPATSVPAAPAPVAAPAGPSLRPGGPLPGMAPASGFVPGAFASPGPPAEAPRFGYPEPTVPAPDLRAPGLAPPVGAPVFVPSPAPAGPAFVSAGSSAPAAAPGASSSMDAAVGSTRAMSTGQQADLRVHAALRAFCDAFVDLRRGAEEAGAELGVRTVSGSTPLHSARDGAELMAYMTESGADPTARAQELRALTADLAVHQVAMMEGVSRGVRALLASLDPQECGIEKGPRFMPILDKEGWRRYTERFAALMESDHELNALVFGPEFAEGYASVIYGSQSRGRRR
ncbi:MAG: FHA domain-containing protein [Myxococcales bacterium]|nr:FHA domain-containing protein [Myxococcales bacterium]